ncbi:NAD(P)-binding protein [Lentithecium fluviatile CBS 122367]|uniref:NAD(P)-binding protein n=1 Tax=Lentithecium fluviatile CBS 122367 TaxID=1168545 RepID=A0A6G1IYR7_9PLEO|nr:NAD(P)-binding protein [Lentithecium fluviatile CBS 122367]
MPGPPGITGYDFPGLENLHNDIYPSISAAQTHSLKQPGKVVLITGASRGIGRAIALQYAHADVSCLIISGRSSSTLAEVEQDIRKINAGTRVLKFAVNVTDSTAVHACAEEVTKKEGRLDILINNAGGTDPWKHLTEAKPSDWWSTLEINLKGPYLFLHAFLPLLVATAEKYKVVTDVINMSSIGALMIHAGASSYGISKLALLRLSEFVEAEYGGSRVNVVSLHPGGVLTELGSSEESIRPYMIDTAELAGGFCVWITAEARRWLAGRYLAATWDVEKLESMREEIVDGDKLRVRLVV